MLMDYLEALVELYPQCEAVYNANSGKLIKADDIRKKEMTGIDRFIRYAVNVRFFNVEGTEDSVVDTLGLSLLYIEDLQYHFHDIQWKCQYEDALIQPARVVMDVCMDGYAAGNRD